MDLQATLSSRDASVRCKRSRADRQYAEHCWGNIRHSSVGIKEPWKFDSSKEGQEGSADYRVTPKRLDGTGREIEPLRCTIEFE
jgi:hypothetical protein